MKDLIPCPFCGAKQDKTQNSRYSGTGPFPDSQHEHASPMEYFVVCRSCGARGPCEPYGDEKLAIALWNKQDDKLNLYIADLESTNDALKKENEQLRTILSKRGYASQVLTALDAIKAAPHGFNCDTQAWDENTGMHYTDEEAECDCWKKHALERMVGK